MRLIAIYVLVDPREPTVVRYVGRTKVPRVRHLQHCAETVGTSKGSWIESLRLDGVMPQMRILEWVKEADAGARERSMVDRYRSTVYNAEAKTKSLEPKPPPEQPPLKGEMHEMRRSHIVKMLDQTNWNKAHAAHRLGIGRQTLYNLIQRYSISRPQPQT